MERSRKKLLKISADTTGLIVAVVLIIVIATSNSGVHTGEGVEEEQPEPLMVVDFQEPYVFHKQGYEAGNAVYSTGALKFTAERTRMTSPHGISGVHGSS